LIGATTLSTGCANPNDPKVQARKQLAAARKAEEQARKQEEAERKREAQAAAKQAEIDRKNAIAMEKQQAKLAKEQRDREESYARAHGGVSMYDPQGWNVDKAVGNPTIHGDYIGADWPTEAQVRAVDNHTQKAAAR